MRSLSTKATIDALLIFSEGDGRILQAKENYNEYVTRPPMCFRCYSLLILLAIPSAIAAANAGHDNSQIEVLQRTDTTNNSERPLSTWLVPKEGNWKTKRSEQGALSMVVFIPLDSHQSLATVAHTVIRNDGGADVYISSSAYVRGRNSSRIYQPKSQRQEFQIGKVSNEGEIVVHWLSSQKTPLKEDEVQGAKQLKEIRIVSMKDKKSVDTGKENLLKAILLEANLSDNGNQLGPVIHRIVDNPAGGVFLVVSATELESIKPPGYRRKRGEPTIRFEISIPSEKIQTLGDVQLQILK